MISALLKTSENYLWAGCISKWKLSSFHTGEMVPYYFMRYGFYEGHTSYRADPVAIAFIFGLKNIEGIDKVFDDKLYEVLTEHHTR